MLNLAELPEEHVSSRFADVAYRGERWCLGHLDPFAVRVELGDIGVVNVVVLFSCHCFTHGLSENERRKGRVASQDLYNDGKERRVLDPVRYGWSLRLLPRLVQELPQRKIIVANGEQRNFMTWEVDSENGERVTYAVFFIVRKDPHRSKRLILRVQSAYVLDEPLTKRQKEAKKVGWLTLLRAAYLGRPIRA